MAKSGKKPQTRRESAPKAPTKSASTANAPPTDYLCRETPVPEAALWRQLFIGLAALGLLVLLWLSAGSGINADDRFQVDYSEKLVNYYASWGKDTAALYIPDGNMHLYGGFFETLVGAANRAMGLNPDQLAYHQTRHAASALLGWVAILCAALLARLIAGWRAGFIALLLLLLSPRFVGDSLMNPKDIPFAAGYMLALYNLCAALDRMPRPRIANLAGLAAGLGIALALRAGGLLAFAIVMLFAGLHFLLKNDGLRALGNTEQLRRYAILIPGVLIAGYVFALLFWPYALQAPLKNPFVALSKFEDLEVKIRVLFEGVNVMSDKTPATYPLKWMYYTIPLSVLAGLFGALALLPRLLRSFNPLWIALLAFAGFFPVFYIVYKNSVVHDGWRHLSFVYPPLVALAALFWNELLRIFSEKKVAQYAVAGAMALLTLDAAAFIVRNPAFPYVYFNPLRGGVEGAFGQYETDYWGLSIRQGIEWLEREGILSEGRGEPVVIATNMFYSARRLTAKYGDKVKIKYLKWEKRCDDTWDYALYPTRFISGSALRKDHWPPSNAAHVVKANQTPLLFVLKNQDNACAEGMAALKAGDYPKAISLLQEEVNRHPDNEVAWISLVNAYLNTQNLEAMKQATDKALELDPDDAQANNMLGLYYLYRNEPPKAKAQFEHALQREPQNASAWYYLAVIAQNQRDFNTALNNLNKAIEIAPNFKPAYELAAQIHETNGNPAQAQRIRQAIGQMK